MKTGALNDGASEMNPQESWRPAPQPVTIDPAFDPMISRVDANLKQEVIITTADKARLCLRDAFDNMERSNAWQTPLGILVGMLSTFQDLLGVSKDIWKGLLIPAALFSAIWLIWCLFRIRRSPTVEQVVHRLGTANSMGHPSGPVTAEELFASVQTLEKQNSRL